MVKPNFIFWGTISSLFMTAYVTHFLLSTSTHFSQLYSKKNLSRSQDAHFAKNLAKCNFSSKEEKTTHDAVDFRYFFAAVTSSPLTCLHEDLSEKQFTCACQTRVLLFSRHAEEEKKEESFNEDYRQIAVTSGRRGQRVQRQGVEA